ncbi:MAG: GGGtGRT protein, partial [Clostridia bacterium]|nr:GGGtGRT protein [Clostridia bacterium]
YYKIHTTLLGGVFLCKAAYSSVPAHVEMMGLMGAGNNPMVGMTVACAVAVEEASK